MPAMSSVHHSHHLAPALSAHNTHETGHPPHSDSPYMSSRGRLCGTAVGIVPDTWNLVLAPPITGQSRALIRFRS